MFDLKKDIDRYQGIPPYASEHYGIYQPLLGWNSKLTKDWVRIGANVVDPRLRSIVDGRIKPGPERDVDFIALPLQPGSGKDPWRVSLVKDLDSELLKLLRDAVQEFVNGHGGALPVGAQWNRLMPIDQLMDAQNGPLRVVNDRHRERILARMRTERGGLPPEVVEAAAAEHLAVMQMSHRSRPCSVSTPRPRRTTNRTH